MMSDETTTTGEKHEQTTRIVYRKGRAVGREEAVCSTCWISTAEGQHRAPWPCENARLRKRVAALEGALGQAEVPGPEFMADETEKGWREFLVFHRREVGRPLSQRDAALARMAYLSGCMNGAQVGAYLLYVHQLTRTEADERQGGEQ